MNFDRHIVELRDTAKIWARQAQEHRANAQHHQAYADAATREAENAESLAEGFTLLADALAVGRLTAEQLRDLIAEVTRSGVDPDTGRPYNEARVNDHTTELAAIDGNEDDTPFASLSGEQANGNACRVCGGEFKPGEAIEPSGYIVGGGQLFAHNACIDDEA